MRCGLEKTTCMARQGDECLEHLLTDTPSCLSRVPANNFDHLRSMSDEELARFLWEQNGSDRYWRSVEKYIEWGRSPYKEEQHGT